MKKICSLWLFLGLSTLSFAQQKPEYGLLASAGTYTYPGHKQSSPIYADTDNQTLNFKPGSSYTFGIWHSWPLGKRFKVSAEFHYRHVGISATLQNRFSFSNASGIFESSSIQERTTRESSFVLPVYLHYSFKKAPKLAFRLGAGVSRAFSWVSNAKIVSKLSGSPDNTAYLNHRSSNWDDFAPQINLNAGLHYKIDPKTSLGLDYTFEFYNSSYYAGSLILIDPSIDCLCFFGNQEFRSNMNSFSVSLRHNILD